MAFTYGLSQLLVSVLLGATLLLERSFAFPARTLERLDAEEATVFPAVPTVFATIVGQSGAAPHPIGALPDQRRRRASAGAPRAAARALPERDVCSGCMGRPSACASATSSRS